MCETWRRWRGRVFAEAEGEGRLPEGLPPALVRQIREAADAVWRLHQAVVPELTKRRPTAKVRFVFGQDSPPTKPGKWP